MSQFHRHNPELVGGDQDPWMIHESYRRALPPDVADLEERRQAVEESRRADLQRDTRLLVLRDELQWFAEQLPHSTRRNCVGDVMAAVDEERQAIARKWS